MLLSVHVTMLGLLLLMRYYCRNNKYTNKHNEICCLIIFSCCFFCYYTTIYWCLLVDDYYYYYYYSTAVVVSMTIHPDMEYWEHGSNLMTTPPFQNQHNLPVTFCSSITSATWYKIYSAAFVQQNDSLSDSDFASP